MRTASYIRAAADALGRHPELRSKSRPCSMRWAKIVGATITWFTRSGWRFATICATATI